MDQRIPFDGRMTFSRLRNGLIKTTGVEVADLRPPAHALGSDKDHVIHIQAITSRGSAATGYVEVPFDEKTLRALADHFHKLALEAAGPDHDAQVRALLGVVNHQLDNQSMAHEDLVDQLDGFMYDLLGDVAAAEVNNHGFSEQLKVIVMHGRRDFFLNHLEIEGVYPREVLDSVYRHHYKPGSAA